MPNLRGKNLTTFSPPIPVPSPVEHYSHLVALKTIEIPWNMAPTAVWNPKTPKKIGHRQVGGTCLILAGLDKKLLSYVHEVYLLHQLLVHCSLISKNY